MFDDQALSQQQAVNHPLASADVIRHVFHEGIAKLRILDREGIAAMELSAAVLPRNPAEKAIRIQVTLLQNRNEPAMTFRAQRCP